MTIHFEQTINFMEKKIVFSRKNDSNFGILYSILILNENPFRSDQVSDRFHGEKKSGFVDSGFVKTCDELVIGQTIAELRCPIYL